MTLAELRSQVIRLPGGGVLTDDTRFDFLDIDAAIHFARAVVIPAFYAKTKRISGEWLQTFTATYDVNIQESDEYVIFDVPRGIPLDVMRDGYLYIGNTDGNSAYRRVNSLAELATYNQHRITKTNNNTAKVLYYEGKMRVYGNTMVKELMTNGIYANPTEILTFNQDIDNYPISEDLIQPIRDYLWQKSLAIEIQKLPDTISDSKDTTIRQ